jgi:hypothetical protein
MFEEYVTLRGPALVRFARLLARDGELGETPGGWVTEEGAVTGTDTSAWPVDPLR